MRLLGGVCGSDGVHEAAEGFMEIVGRDGGVAGGVGVDIESGEDRLVEQFAGVVGGGVVQIAWPVE
ncbi:MAG: hypothetical protein ACRDTT_09055 [Pseudonocardiaceae bacterium]